MNIYFVGKLSVSSIQLFPVGFVEERDVFATLIFFAPSTLLVVPGRVMVKTFPSPK
jgi:hypothetical protein